MHDDLHTTNPGKLYRNLLNLEGKAISHLAEDGLVVNASVDNSAAQDVLLILFSLLYCYILFVQVLIAAEALHSLLCQVACTGNLRDSMKRLKNPLC